MRVLSPFMVMAAASCAWAASAVCQSQPPPPPAAAMPAAAPGDASALVARLKQRYQELNSVPVRLTEVFQTRTRSLGNQDVTATGTLITYQLGENARSVL